MTANRSCSDCREACKKWGGMGPISFGCPRAGREGKGGGVKSMVAQTRHLFLVGGLTGENQYINSSFTACCDYLRI